VKFRAQLLPVVALCAAASTTLSAQADPTPIKRSLFTWEDAALGGAFVLTTIAIRPLDKRAADVLQQPNRQRNRFLRKTAVAFKTIAAPGSVIIGLTMYTSGRLANNDKLAELGLHGTEALFVGEGVGTVLKDFFGRARPFVDTSGPNPDDWQIDRGFRRGDRYQSFPSGHTTAAFAAAAAVSAETSEWWPALTYFGIGPVMYGGAAAVGLSRMYNNRHWASDVIMGAAIGTFAGLKVVRYHRAHPDSRFDKALLDVSWNPATGHLGFSILPGLGLPTRKR
jgi:membrane-associated phospholipid phosphatase